MANSQQVSLSKIYEGIRNSESQRAMHELIAYNPVCRTMYYKIVRVLRYQKVRKQNKSDVPFCTNTKGQRVKNKTLNGFIAFDKKKMDFVTNKVCMIQLL